MFSILLKDIIRIFFQANKELKITKAATRTDEKLDLISLDDYLKKINMIITPVDPEKPDDGGDAGDGEVPDPTV